LLAVHDAFEIHFPYRKRLVFVEHRVIQVEMYSRFESFVKGTYAIRCENEDSLVIL
jgi:hypothetical protein